MLHFEEMYDLLGYEDKYFCSFVVMVFLVSIIRDGKGFFFFFSGSLSGCLQPP